MVFMNVKTSIQLPFHYWLLWGLVLILIIINIGLIAILVRVKNQTADAAIKASAIIQQAKTQSFSSTVHIEPRPPFTTTVVIDDIFDVSVKTTVPVKTTVDVPVIIPIIGQVAILKVPVNITVPVDAPVKIPVKKSVPINISSPFSFDVPINIKISDTPLDNILQQFHDWLTELAVRLGG